MLDTPAEERFDRLSRVAKRAFGVPIALVGLVDQDRQWFKSCQLVECHNDRAGRRYHLSFSVGAAGYDPQYPPCVADLVAAADALMYRDKHGRAAVGRCG